MRKIEIVTLQPTGWKIYKDLRLRALKEEAQAFASTYEDNAKYPDEHWMKRLEKAAEEKTQWLVFAKLNGHLVGMVGAFAEKEPDNAYVVAVYVVPEARGKGISKLLLQHLLSRIKTNKQIKKVTLNVNPEQLAAFNLYKHLGFKLIKQYKMIMGDSKEHEVYQLQMNVDEL